MKIALALALGVLSLWPPPAASAQESISVARSGAGYVLSTVGSGGSRSTMRFPSAAEMLAAFVTDEGGNLVDLVTVLGAWEHFPRAVVDSLASGLEAIAASDRSEQTRRAAIGILGVAGDRDHARPLPGALSRLVRIYSQAPGALQPDILIHAGASAEPAAAAAFLRRIAVQDARDAGHPAAPSYAVFGLGLLGDEGTTVLRALHAEGAVRDPEARTRLGALAAQGFRMRGRSRQ